MNKISKIIIGIIMIIFIFAAVVFFMSTTIIDSVRVIGNEHNTRNEVLDMVGIYDTSSVLDVIMNRTKNIEDVKYVNRLEVDKSDYKNIIITVIEKEIIGYVEYMGKYICLDYRGYIVDYTDSPDESKPKIRGIDLTTFTVDEPLDVSNTIISSIDGVYRNAVAFDVPIEWIDFQYRQGSRIVVYSGGIEIRIGDISKIEEKFKAINEVMEVLPKDKKGILYVENMEDDIIFKSNE